MDYVLTELLSEVPDEMFFNDQGHPAFNRIFVEVARGIYKEDTDEFLIPAHDFLTGKLPNLSSFQRAVDNERIRRE
jgi:hypothetical protein